MTNEAPVRGVIFDLWDTLVDWPHEAMQRLNVAIAAHIGIDLPELHQRMRATYRLSQTGPFDDALRALGVPRRRILEERFSVF